MIITQPAIDALRVGFSTSYQQGYSTATPWSAQLATTIPSSNRSQVYGWMARIAQLREWIGPRTIENLSEPAYTLENRKFELTIGVSVDDWADTNLGVYAPTFAEMGRAAAEWPDVLTGEAVQLGDTTGLGFDGLSFFNTAHTLDPAGTQSNSLANALTPANYQTARATMMSYTGEDGRPLKVMPTLLVVPPQLERAALEIINADMIPSDAGTASQSNVLRGSAQVLVVPEFADEPTVWYLADTSRPIKPLIFQQRKPPMLVSKAQPTDDNYFFDQQMIWGTDARGAAGYSLWFLMLRSAP